VLHIFAFSSIWLPIGKPEFSAPSGRCRAAEQSGDQSQEKIILLDAPIRFREHLRRNRETNLFCGFQIDDQLKLELATRRAAKSIGMRL